MNHEVKSLSPSEIMLYYFMREKDMAAWKNDYRQQLLMETIKFSKIFQSQMRRTPETCTLFHNEVVHKKEYLVDNYHYSKGLTFHEWLQLNFLLILSKVNGISDAN